MMQTYGQAKYLHDANDEPGSTRITRTKNPPVGGLWGGYLSCWGTTRTRALATIYLATYRSPMPLAYYPNVGEVLACDYGQNVILPEMHKTRPVVVIGPRLRRRADLVGVVPFSTTEPQNIEDYHCKITLAKPLPPPFDSPVMWVKCDMYSSVALARLDRFKEPVKAYGGARKWVSGKLTKEQVKEIQAALLCGLGFSSLTGHL